MSGYGSFDYAKANAQQQSNSVSGLRGTRHFAPAAQQTMDRGRQLNQTVDAAMGNIQNDPQQWYRFSQQVMPGGRYGMGQNVDNAVAMFGQNMFSRTSSDMAQRGFMSPESQNAVVGSALQNASTQLIPQMMQFQQQQFMAPRGLVDTARTAADFWNSTLGQQSTSSGTSDSFKFGGAGGGGVCWIAEALYGTHAPETHLARWYVLNHLWKPLLKLYQVVGQAVARQVQRHSWVAATLRPVFNWMVRRAVKLGALR